MLLLLIHNTNNANNKTTHSKVSHETLKREAERSFWFDLFYSSQSWILFGTAQSSGKLPWVSPIKSRSLDTIHVQTPTCALRQQLGYLNIIKERCMECFYLVATLLRRLLSRSHSLAKVNLEFWPRKIWKKHFRDIFSSRLPQGMIYLCFTYIGTSDERLWVVYLSLLGVVLLFIPFWLLWACSLSMFPHHSCCADSLSSRMLLCRLL